MIALLVRCRPLNGTLSNRLGVQTGIELGGKTFPTLLRTNERTNEPVAWVYIFWLVCVEGSRSPGWGAVDEWNMLIESSARCAAYTRPKEIQYPLSRPLAGEKQCLSLYVSCVSYASLSFCVVYMHDSRRGTWKRSRRRSWCSLLLSTPFSLRMIGIWVVIMQDPSRTKMNAFCFARDIWPCIDRRIPYIIFSPHRHILICVFFPFPARIDIDNKSV